MLPPERRTSNKQPNGGAPLHIRRHADDVASRIVEAPIARARASSFDRLAAVGAVAEWAVVAVLVVTLSLYAYLGRYTRYVADDYTLSNGLHARGYWTSQI